MKLKHKLIPITFVSLFLISVFLGSLGAIITSLTPAATGKAVAADCHDYDRYPDWFNLMVSGCGQDQYPAPEELLILYNFMVGTGSGDLNCTSTASGLNKNKADGMQQLMVVYSQDDGTAPAAAYVIELDGATYTSSYTKMKATNPDAWGEELAQAYGNGRITSPTEVCDEIVNLWFNRTTTVTGLPTGDDAERAETAQNVVDVCWGIWATGDLSSEQIDALKKSYYAFLMGISKSDFEKYVSNFPVDINSTTNCSLIEQNLKITRTLIAKYKKELLKICKGDGDAVATINDWDDDQIVQAWTAVGSGASCNDVINAGDPKDDKTNDCESAGFPFSWVICQVIDLTAKAADGMFDNLISPLLVTKPFTADKSDMVYKAWSNVRIYGNLFLVIALIVIVFGESIGGGLIEAYTVKKVLPRILAAAILINISFYLVAIAVDIANIVGIGLKDLITAPFTNTEGFNVQVGNKTGVVALVGTSAGIWAFGGVAAATVFAPEFIALLALFVLLPLFLLVCGITIVIFLRQALIVFLVVLSPFAFALYCLPNTEKYFRQWWDTLFKALLVFPIITSLFALSKVMAILMDKLAPGAIGNILALIAFAAPLFMIPFAFKLAGGILGRVLDFASSSGKRLSEGVKGNPNDANSLRNKYKRRFNENYTRQANRRLKAADGPGTGISKRFRARTISAIDGRVNERMSRYNKEAGDLKEMIAATGNDDDHYAAVSYVLKAGETATEHMTSGGKRAQAVTNHDRTFDGKGREISASYAARARGLLAGNESESGSMLEYVGRKIQTDGDMDNFRKSMAAVAVRENMSQGEIAGMQAQALFGHKDKFPEFYYEQPKVQTVGGKTVGVKWDSVSSNTEDGRKNRNGMVKELHKTKAGFQLSSLRDGTIRSWHDERSRIQEDMDKGKQVSYEDAEFFAMTDDILESVVNRGLADPTSGSLSPELSAGLTPAGQQAVKALMANRRYRTRAAKDAKGEESLSEKEIYQNVAPASGIGPVHQRVATIAPPPATAVGLSPGRVHVGNSVAVTGDSERSGITTSE